MDERAELRHHSPGICNRLYNFIMRTLTSHALKIVNLGHASPGTTSGVTKLGATSRWDQAVHPMAREISVEGESLEAIVGAKQACPEVENSYISGVPSTEKGKSEEATGRPEAEVASETERRVPKKTVSINDTVEEITMSTRRNRRNKSFEKFPSLESEIDDLKPLKSILKVGSNLNGRV